MTLLVLTLVLILVLILVLTLVLTPHSWVALQLGAKSTRIDLVG